MQGEHVAERGLGWARVPAAHCRDEKRVRLVARSIWYATGHGCTRAVCLVHTWPADAW